MKRRQTTDGDSTKRYAQMGMAALLPGMLHMLTMMQEKIDELRAQLTGLEIEPRRVTSATRLGRPRKNVEAVHGRASNGWPVDPEERSEEMKRRQRVAANKRIEKALEANKATHPREANHPGHADWLKKLRKSQKKAWNALTPAQQRTRLAKMQAGRPKPAVKLAAVS